MEFDKTKFKKLFEEIRKEQGVDTDETPHFTFGRDVCHKDEPCYFCGFTGNIHGEGRYISENYEQNAIQFCGKCEAIIDEKEILEMEFE